MLLTRMLPGLFALTLLVTAPAAHGGAQLYEPLSASVRAALTKAVSDRAVPYLAFDTVAEARSWLQVMSAKLEKRIPDRVAREELLVTVHYEAKRAGLDPQLVLGLIQVESAFRKYAVSPVGARGYMQVMPFWIGVIGGKEDNLFHMRTNLRYGCVILRHYLDVEKGDLYRALGRYNGSVGRPQYPNTVLAAWQGTWTYSAPSADTTRRITAARM
jgi:soluble lytic murein transglycosylase-like protein